MQARHLRQDVLTPAAGHPQDADAVGEALRERRAARKWSRDDLATAAGLLRTCFGSEERAEHCVALDNAGEDFDGALRCRRSPGLPVSSAGPS